jgi:flavorubredoxin
MARFIIVYNSTTGNTKAMAEAIKEGAESLNLETEVVEAFDVNIDDLLAAEAIGFGGPTMNYHPAKPLLRILDELGGHNVKGKTAVSFGSYGWDGLGPVVIAERLREMGFRVLDPVERVVYKPTENELECLRHLGKDVAMAVKKMPHLKNLNAQ